MNRRFIIKTAFAALLLCCFDVFAYASDRVAAQSTCLITAKVCTLTSCQIHNGTGIGFQKINNKVYIMTAAHVVSYGKASEIYCAFTHGRYPAKVLRQDGRIDLAVLVIDTYTPEKFTVTPVANDDPDLSSTYYSYQHPGGNPNQTEQQLHYKSKIEVDRVSYPGASGSGVTRNGRLYGIVLASNYDTDKNMTIVVPTDEIRKFVNPWGITPDGDSNREDLMNELRKKQEELAKLREQLDGKSSPTPEPESPKPAPTPQPEKQPEQTPLIERGVLALLNLLAQRLGLTSPVGVIGLSSLATFLGFQILKRGATYFAKKKLGQILGGSAKKATEPLGPERTILAELKDEPTVPAPTVPAPTVPAPTVPAPAVPAPAVPAPAVPAPAVPAPTVPTPVVQPTNLTVNQTQDTNAMAKLLELLLIKERGSADAATKSGQVSPQLPPRDVTELNDVLRLARTEGVDLHLATARGLFINDELDLLEQSSDEKVKALAKELRSKIDGRVASVAPLSFKPENL